MGTLGNGDGGPHDDLPELPPGWGPIRIPDDASELAHEAEQVRRELREQPRAARPPEVATVPRRRTAHGLATEPANLRLPLLIMSAALLAAVVSLFAVAWPGDRRPPSAERTPTSTSRSTRMVPAVELLDEKGGTVAVRGLLPAAVLLTDGCACAPQVATVDAAAPDSVTVATVTREPPPTGVGGPPAPTSVRRLRDPSGALHDFFGVQLRSGVAPLILIGASGEIVRVVTAASPAADLAGELALLPTR